MDKDAAVSETRTTRCHQCGFAVPTFDWEDAYGGIKAERDALRAEVERLTQALKATNDQWEASTTSALEIQREQAADVAALRAEIESLMRHT